MTKSVMTKAPRAACTSAGALGRFLADVTCAWELYGKETLERMAIEQPLMFFETMIDLIVVAHRELGEYWDVALERHLDLDADHVVALPDSGGFFWLIAKPSRPDHNDQDFRLGPGIVNEFAKIGSKRNAFDVEEYRLSAVAGGQLVGDAARDRRRVDPAV